LKKTNKSNCPVFLSSYAQSNPDATWEDFRQDSQGQSYRTVRLQAIQDQGGLCAYCETPSLDKPEKFSIEHYHPKADTANPAINWALKWDNLHAVCRGGREKSPDATQAYPTPENLSCDAYKDHRVTKKQLPEDCEGYVFNPLSMPAAKIFKFNKSNGALEVDKDACANIYYYGCNNFPSLADLAEETLRVLNLNCQRLCDARLEVLIFYSRKIKEARLRNNKQIFQQLAQSWFSTRWPSFFTTRRDLLDQNQAAEKYLQSINYNG